VHDNRRTRLVLGVLLIIAITLITLDFKDGGASPVRGVGANIFGPIERVTHDVTDPVASVLRLDHRRPVGAGHHHHPAAPERRAPRRAQRGPAEQVRPEATRPAAAARRGRLPDRDANVIAAGGGFSDTVTLDVGSDDGIKADETVLNGSGFVGLVTQVSANTSTVLLASDASSVVGVQLAGSGEIGAVTGTGKSLSGSAMLRLSLFDANAVLHPGQQVVSYASVGDKPQVPGVPSARSSR
jgi:Cell shape-determining protein